VLNTARAALLALGLAIAIFGLLALTGPGRIDIVDGQTRYEVSRSIVDHGDLQIRNPQVWFAVFPGRNGQAHTYYRLPHSLAGVPAILLADLMGPPSEPRRHFSFVLTSAVAAGLLAGVYVLWFLSTGLSAPRAVFWAAAGILCTPNWYYGTTTFDDIFGSLVVTSAMGLAWGTRENRARSCDLLVGVLIGVAFNCKEPLGVFGLAALAARDMPSAAVTERVKRAACTSVGLLAGVGFYLLVEFWKFPPGAREQHAQLLEQYFPAFTGFSWLAPLAFAVSPAAGVLWYFPPILLCAAGVRSFLSEHRRSASALLASVAVFSGFICSLSFFKGDPAWGPRYLTTVFGVLWLFAPRGAAPFRRIEVSTLLVLGAGIQLMALTVDPYRLYIQRSLPSTFGARAPALYFDPANSHLLNRPRELFEVWNARHQSGVAFTAWEPPSATVTILDRVELGRGAVEKYKVLNSFRPWWISHLYMRDTCRPVPILRTVLVLLSVLGAGVLLVLLGAHMASSQERSRSGGALP
jgi:hypothetical protein